MTENPDGREVHLLLNYAKTAPIETFEIVDHLITELPDRSLSIFFVSTNLNLFFSKYHSRSDEHQANSRQNKSTSRKSTRQ